MERAARAIDALSVFMMGLGVFLLLLGPSAGLYNIAVGLLALAACWVMAITFRVLCFGSTRDYHRDRYVW